MNFGKHFLVEFGGCESARLNDLKFLQSHCLEAALASGATVVGDKFHAFSPQGVTGVILLAESHLSVHTWPEHQVAIFDFFSCSSEMKVERAIEIIERALGASSKNVRCLDRSL